MREGPSIESSSRSNPTGSGSSKPGRRKSNPRRREPRGFFAPAPASGRSWVETFAVQFGQHMNDCFKDRAVVIGFGEKPSFRWQVAFIEDGLAGYDNQLHRRPPASYVMGQL